MEWSDFFLSFLFWANFRDQTVYSALSLFLSLPSCLLNPVGNLFLGKIDICYLFDNLKSSIRFIRCARSKRWKNFREELPK